ncbi:ATP-binding protein [Corynebacterium durum]|uniref:ATP-binding protein n=1 Tax=Corynebacterium durum TaxID=61592 RepID=UPI002352615E|nr:ATP-binding protein [Corynebacterium durum]
MDQALNPYSPGAGIRPAALVGRSTELTLIDTMISRTARGLHNRGIIVHGLRGVGKTVLLNEIARKAEAADWLTVRIEATSDKKNNKHVRTRLARELTQSARKISVRKRWKHILDILPVINAFSTTLGFTGVSFNADIKTQTGRGDSGVLELDLEELVLDVSAAAHKDGKALAFFIDEMQDLDAEMLSALITAQHQAGQRGLPFFIFGAGLPTLPAVLAQSHSYAERLFEYRSIGALDDDAARAALSEPAEFSGAQFTPRALEILITAAENYPYFLQEYGKAIWEIAVASPFTPDDAKLAIGQGTEALDQGFFPSRWERATPAERAFLAAMADIGHGDVSISDIATHLGAKVTSIGTNRLHLIQKGLVYSPQHGYLRFTVPGMNEYIQRNQDDATS